MQKLLNTLKISAGLALTFSWMNLSAATLPEINQRDLVPNVALKPTTYHIAYESKTSCKGRYNGRTFNGTERKEILTPDGDLIAEVCARYYYRLAMEGTGVLSAANGGHTVNWKADWRFIILNKCVYGRGEEEKCLLPFHTIAANNTIYPVGTILYIPEVVNRGVTLPNGEKHSGYFVVRDTGGAFQNAGPERVDLFVTDQEDNDNIFINKNIHYPRTYPSYLVIDESKEKIEAYFKAKYPSLW